jgi:hypothetical protein
LCRIFLCSLTLSTTSSFLTWSVQSSLNMRKITIYWYFFSSAGSKFLTGALLKFRVFWDIMLLSIISNDRNVFIFRDSSPSWRWRQICRRPFENVVTFKYFGRTLKNQNFLEDKIKCRLNPENAC